MDTRVPLSLTVAGALLVSLAVIPAWGADWPTYGHDAARGGVTTEQVSTPLHLQWTYAPAQAPRPAWPEPGRELHRLDFDYAYQVAAAKGLVYFGSSADHKVYALDLDTGGQRWSFFTDAPVRFSPVADGDRVFVAGDDGYLYCLSAGEGKVLWRLRAAPADERVFGNEQMVSRWPLRSGVAVDEGVVYVTAGIWPAEGIFVYALRAKDGAVIWKNDGTGHMYLQQPHPPSQGMTGVAPQGYLVVHGDQLFVPTGRNVPAALDRKTGQLLYYRSRPTTWGDRWGGCWAMGASGLLFGRRSHIGPDINVMMGESDPWKDDGIVAFDGPTGEVKLQLVNKHYAVVRGDTLYAWGSGAVSAYDLKALLAGKKPAEAVRWETPCERAYSLILAGDTVLVGGRDTVAAMDARKGEVLWQHAVQGQARGLAVADGRLLVSTSEGRIACFGPRAVAEPPTVAPVAQAAPYPEDGSGYAAQEAAQRVLDETGVRAGYCLCLGVGDGRLAYELARRSSLTVYCLDPDPARVAAARASLDALGLYGTRVVVHQGSMARLPYPDYFANLIVFGPAAAPDVTSWSPTEVYRVLRPCGGVAYLMPPGGAERASASGIEPWLRAGGVPTSEIRVRGSAVQVVRGELAGAGSWTHQYADAGKSSCSQDERVRLPLRTLWFGKPGPAMMVNRHWQGPAPLSIGGQLFVVGQHSVVGVDAYNGRELWARDLTGAGRFPVSSKSSNAAADEESLYVAVGKSCLRVDAQTGETLRTYEAPVPDSVPAERAATLFWDYLAVADGLVFGTLGDGSEGLSLFAMGKDDGELRWVYKPGQSVHHDSIALRTSYAGSGRTVLYLIDKTSTAALDKMKRRGEQAVATGRLVALNATTGRTLWETDRGLSQRYDLRYAPDVLLATGGGRMTAFSARDGKRLAWSDVRMRHFPVIVGDTFYGEPYAYDLRTGQRKTRAHPLTGEPVPWYFSRSYGCGAISAAPAMLLFRSGVLGFCDLAGDTGIHNFGGVRAGCYVNAIVANGLVLMPPADAGCTCSYNFQTTVALAPTQRAEEWSVYTAPSLGAGKKVRRLALNLGAPGDRRAADGTLWLSFPRPLTAAALRVPVTAKLAPDRGYYHLNADQLAMAGTSSPWLYTSGCRGLQSATVNVVVTEQDKPVEAEPRSFTVRLHFAETEDLRPGQRVFDVKLQDRPVFEGLDVVARAGGPNRALVEEFRGVQAKDTIKLELVSRAGAAPIINALQVCEE